MDRVACKDWVRIWIAVLTEQTICRVRPLNEREIQQNDDTIVQAISPEQILLRPDVKANGQSALSGSQSSYNQTLAAKSFTFNAVFDQTSSQSELMKKSGLAKVIEMAIEGYSTTVFCYGQTGSGKTHTLTGPPHLVSGILKKKILQNRFRPLIMNWWKI